MFTILNKIPANIFILNSYWTIWKYLISLNIKSIFHYNETHRVNTMLQSAILCKHFWIRWPQNSNKINFYEQMNKRLENILCHIHSFNRFSRIIRSHLNQYFTFINGTVCQTTITTFTFFDRGATQTVVKTRKTNIASVSNEHDLSYIRKIIFLICV